MTELVEAGELSPKTVNNARTYQPDRNREWRAWLFRTAQREAWTLDQKRRETRPFEDESGDGALVAEPADRRDAFTERDELEAAVDVLGQLPPRLRRIAFLRATGHRYSEIQEITGDSRTRVSQLIRRANEHIREALQELEAAEVATLRERSACASWRRRRRSG